MALLFKKKVTYIHDAKNNIVCNCACLDSSTNKQYSTIYYIHSCRYLYTGTNS